MSEKMRVHILAKELNVSSQAIIDKCKAEGIDTVKNHMSTLSAGLHATIREWFSEGTHETTLETAERVNLDRVRVTRRRKKAAGSPEGDAASDVAVADLDTAADADEDAPVEISEPPPAPLVADAPPPAPKPAEEKPVARPEAAPSRVAPPPRAVEVEAPAPAPTIAPAAPLAADVSQSSAAVVVAVAPTVPVASAPPAPAKSVRPAGPQNVPQAARLQGPRVVRYAAPDYDLPRVRSATSRVGPPDPSALRPPDPARDAAEAAEKDKNKKPKVSPRRITGRLVEAGEKLAEWRDRDIEERRERIAGATGRRIHRRRSSQPAGPGAKGRAPAPEKPGAVVHEPVRLKEFCAETGLNFLQLFKVLRDEHNMIVNINMTIPTETAELLALQFGIELNVIPARTALDELRDEFASRERKNLAARPPIVTVLGHVDHGKTSLLDAIRKTRVVAGEDGGITQHIRSYHVETPHGAVTFLDTPGHVAFTAMRARGAQLTDVVVLVVAANDGVMPQTVEAIRHAQAAEVPIVVALNKIDLGDQNKLKIFGQLAEHGITVSEWGGESDVIPTSATTGAGVRELIEHLAALSSVLELKADPTLSATGTVVEAETKPGVGSVVQLLIQEGTLRVGDIVVCGNSHGKVRAMVNDRGQRLEEAGPSVPVEVWGLDEVPLSGDQLFVVDNLQRAKMIASEVTKKRLEDARLASRKVSTLEEMFKQRDSDEVPELNIVLKADVDGSLAAIKHALAEIPSDEVKLAIRHAAVGPVNDSDVLLASTCRGLVIAFRVDFSGGAKRFADQQGVEIRPYRIIYELVDDIRKALSGLLAPEERIEARATVEVRQVFHMSKLGVVAGCYVTHGTLERSHLVKVIRDGVVIREGSKLSSLRHFKDDVREVRAGFECGLRVEGFDDVHAGDRIESYEVVKIARSL